MTHRPNTHRHADAGSATIELVLLTPPIILTLLFIVALGRIAGARQHVDAAARDAARTASLARSPAPPSGGHRRGRSNAGRCGSHVSHLDVALDTSDFRPGGQVTARITCIVALDDLTLLDVPGAKQLHATATRPSTPTERRR
ncbi:MAG: pilus assembly protein [Acidimicrobiales bacterium]